MSYLLHSVCLVVILKFYTVTIFLHAVRNFEYQKEFLSKRVNFFTAIMTSFLKYFTATLRALFLHDAAHFISTSYVFANLHENDFLVNKSYMCTIFVTVSKVCGLFHGYNTGIKSSVISSFLHV